MRDSTAGAWMEGEAADMNKRWAQEISKGKKESESEKEPQLC
jgi:hypothetical protein